VEHSTSKSSRATAAKAVKKSVVREYAEAILIALVAALFLRAFVVQAFKIPSGSMIPTLEIGDHILVNKLAYGVRSPDINWLPIVGCVDLSSGSHVVEWDMPKRGDVVVFVYPRDRCKDFIKRVVGVPGDMVEIRDKQVYINGEPVVEDAHAYYEDPNVVHGANRPRDNFGPVQVPDNHIFVMGDNRDRSYDSRFWGFVPIQDVRGRAFIKYFSWDSDESQPRWNRIGNLIY